MAGKGRTGKWETPSPPADDEDSGLGKRKAGGGRADTEGLMRAATATGDAAAAQGLLENRLSGRVGRTGAAGAGCCAAEFHRTPAARPGGTRWVSRLCVPGPQVPKPHLRNPPQPFRSHYRHAY